MSNQDTMTASEAMRKSISNSTFVRITNSTSEKILVYGPERETDGGSYDNSWYILNPGQTTPGWWECDGLFVPNDRKFAQETGPTVQGPVAIKYSKFKTITITQVNDQYLASGDPNDGVFHRDEIDWSIPDVSSEDCQKVSRLAYEIPRE